jgi:hypothetical protein
MYIIVRSTCECDAYAQSYIRLEYLLSSYNKFVTVNRTAQSLFTTLP